MPYGSVQNGTLLVLSWTRLTPSISSHTFNIHFKLINHLHLEITNGHFPSSFPTETLFLYVSCLPWVLHTPLHFWRNKLWRLVIFKKTDWNLYALFVLDKAFFSNIKLRRFFQRQNFLVFLAMDISTQNIHNNSYYDW